MNYALINSESIVINLIAYDGAASYTPAEGLTFVQVPEGTDIGGTYTGSGG